MKNTIKALHMKEENTFQINLKEIVRTKAPKLNKKLPGFLISWLERIIHQKELNYFLATNAEYTGVDLMVKATEFFDVKLNIVGKENIPSFDEKCVFAANHPLGGLDGVCLSAYLGERYHHRIKYLVNDILYFIKPLQNIFIPINKHGGQAKSGATALNEAFASDNQIITFPAGLCSRKIDRKIVDLEWKKMFISKAIEYKRDIVPVYFEARNSNLFYNLAQLRRALGLKFNVEMLFLPGEMFKNKSKTFTIYFGKAIPWQTFDSSKTIQQWADWVKESVYSGH